MYVYAVKHRMHSSLVIRFALAEKLEILWETKTAFPGLLLCIRIRPSRPQTAPFMMLRPAAVRDVRGRHKRTHVV